MAEKETEDPVRTLAGVAETVTVLGRMAASTVTALNPPVPSAARLWEVKARPPIGWLPMETVADDPGMVVQVDPFDEVAAV